MWMWKSWSADNPWKPYAVFMYQMFKEGSLAVSSYNKLSRGRRELRILKCPKNILEWKRHWLRRHDRSWKLTWTWSHSSIKNISAGSSQKNVTPPSSYTLYYVRKIQPGSSFTVSKLNQSNPCTYLLLFLSLNHQKKSSLLQMWNWLLCFFRITILPLSVIMQAQIRPPAALLPRPFSICATLSISTSHKSPQCRQSDCRGAFLYMRATTNGV